MTRKEILEAAEQCVCTDRESQYGSPESSFGLIGRLWQEYLKAKCVGLGAEVCVEPEDVANLMALLKIARIATGQTKADNYVDLAGYAACGGELAAVKPCIPKQSNGKWIHSFDDKGCTSRAYCSVCKFEINFYSDQAERCPRCDAKMENPVVSSL